MLYQNVNIGKIALSAVFAAGLVLHSTPPAFAVSDLIADHDKDNDKTLDLAEVKAAAAPNSTN